MPCASTPPSHGIDYPVLVGEQGGLEAANAFGMDTVLPFSVFADRTGRIITLKVGELHRDEAELILDRMRDVELGRISLAGGPGADLARHRASGRPALDPGRTAPAGAGSFPADPRKSQQEVA